MSVTIEPIESAAGPFAAINIDLGQLRVQLLSLGAAIRTVEVPDAQGVLGHVHLALPHPADHADHARNPHLGGTLGRFANRIAHGRFTLDGQEYMLDVNNDGNTLFEAGQVRGGRRIQQIEIGRRCFDAACREHGHNERN